MSISSEITRISGNVSDALTAIANKGVTVPSGSNSDDLADLIAQISGGGGSSGGVIVQDEDGYLVLSPNEANAVRVSRTADSHGGDILNIEAVNASGGGGTSVTESVWMAAAEPTDNNLHLWIDLDPALGLDVRLYLDGTGTIDWGDGNTDSSNTSWPKAHSYAESGVYEIVVSGAFTIPLNNTIIQTNPYLYKSRRLLRRAYVPAKDIGQYKFQNCYALEKVTIKGNGKQGTATTIGMYCFSPCYALREIIIPDGVSTLGGSAFANTMTATYVSIPSTCTEIGASCFNYCGSLEFHIAATTPPNLLNTNAFNNGQSGALIYVPYSADHSVLAEYENASNWATLYTNGRIVEESP